MTCFGQDTLRAVRILWSRRRTFLLKKIFVSCFPGFLWPTTRSVGEINFTKSVSLSCQIWSFWSNVHLAGNTVADLRGGARDARPPGPNFLRFHAVFRKNLPNNRLALPPLGLAPPPLGNPGSATVIFFRICVTRNIRNELSYFSRQMQPSSRIIYLYICQSRWVDRRILQQVSANKAQTWCCAERWSNKNRYRNLCWMISGTKEVKYWRNSERQDVQGHFVSMPKENAICSLFGFLNRD